MKAGLPSVAFAKRWNIYGQANAHEKPGKGLGQVLAVWRHQANTVASLSRKVPEVGVWEAVDSTEIDDAQFAFKLR